MAGLLWLQRGPLPFEAEAYRFLVEENIAGAVFVFKKRGYADEIISLGKQTDGIGSINSNTRFPLASLSKVITSAAIRELIGSGALDVDEKLIRVLPDLPYGDTRYAEVTVRNLLQHTAGFSADAVQDPMFDAQGRVMGCDAAIVHTVSQKLRYAPGENIQYSNTGYCLLGRILEKVEGRTYEAAVNQLIMQPRKISSLTLGPKGADEERGWAENYSPDSWRSLEAAGGWFGDAPTVASLYQEDAQKLMFKNMMPKAPFKDYYYGLGWRVWPRAQRNFLTHFGVLPGVFSFVIAFPDGSLGVGLFNGRPERAEDAAQFLASIFAKKLDQNLFFEKP
ncbi:serine hydrolase domain-containing protein [Variovorax boronicumulans]|uniref:serine hydrolase domain-containing protein n=1 Tax=Variovorax boronicumulans TaxID=436515 RepID=UPI00277EF77E|nr:serine hydrolase domain-containing protein [Variovorax boronicumulans]MDQ0043188.1 CubicO group peptidase (beta-lactamase class C family) [Variovorax boronicumulans]